MPRSFAQIALFVSVGSLWAQSDRATIAGVVTDQSGAVMAGVGVTATNTATGNSNSAKTGASGTFTIPLLRIGPYQVVAEFRGFKKFVQSGIVLEVGQTVAMDIHMQVGAVTEVVQVTAQPLMDKDTSNRSTVVSARDVEELPIVAPNGEQRNPGFYMSLVPGVFSRGTSNQGPSGGGRQLDTVVNGSQSGSTEFQLEGVTIGEQGMMSGDFHPLVFPPEAVGEFQVMTLNVPAEYGASGNGITSFALKSGTNTLHGELFENLRNEDLDANYFFANAGAPGCTAHPEYTKACRTLNKQNEFGATAGGPVYIPHIYNGKDKTFFFGWYHGYRLSQQGGTNAKDTLPTEAMKGGDESNVLSGNVGTDALGRPVFGSEIYDPATQRSVPAGTVDPVTGLRNTTANSALIRDAFGATAGNGWRPSNIVPTGRQDPVAVKMFSYFANPPSCPSCVDGYVLNWLSAYPVRSTINDWGSKIDHNISSNNRIMGEFVWWHDYAPGGSKWPGAISEGGIAYTQDDIARFSDDYILSPNLVNHFSAGFNRSRSDNFPTAGVGWPAKLGYAGVPQTGADTTFPEMDIGGLGNTYARGSQSYSATNNWNIGDNITWVKNRHTVKVGFDWVRLGLNEFGANYQSSYNTYDAGTTSLAGPWFNNSGTINGTSPGFGAAGFLLGQVTSGEAGLSTATTGSRVGRYDGYVMDDIKWSPKLTLNLGLRYDLMLPIVDQHNFESWADPSVIDPVIGIPGSQVYATTARRSPAMADKHELGPRVGLAYAWNDKTVIRTSYGIMYAAGGAERIQGGTDQDYGWSVVNNVGADSSTGYQGLLPGVVAGVAGYHFILQNGFPSNLFTPPPFKTPNFTLGQGPPSVGSWPNDGHLPYMQNWTMDIQRQVRGGIILDVAYVGSKGTHLPSRLQNSNAMQTFYATSPTMQFPVEGAANGNYIMQPLADPTVQGLQIVQHMPVSLGVDVNGNPAAIHQPFAGFQNLWGGKTAQLGQALRPFPQWTVDTSEGLSQMKDLGETVGKSNYNSLQVQARKHFSQGLSFMAAYTYSKSLTDAGSATNEFGGFTQDFYNQKYERAVSINDYPNNFVISYEYQLPFGPGKKFANTHGPVGKIIGGWTISGVQTYVSGEPSLITDGGGAPGYPFVGDTSFSARPNTVPGVAKKSAAIMNHTFDPDAPAVRNDGVLCSVAGNCNYANSTDRGSIYNGAAWSTPAPWTFGDQPQYDSSARRFGYHNEDISIIKRTQITERVNIEFRGDFLNIFNRTLFGFDQGGDQYGSIIGGNNQSSGPGSFGHPSGQSNFPREIQFGLKINY
jgi:hypothetical protein